MLCGKTENYTYRQSKSKILKENGTYFIPFVFLIHKHQSINLVIIDENVIHSQKYILRNTYPTVGRNKIILTGTSRKRKDSPSKNECPGNDSKRRGLNF